MTTKRNLFVRLVPCRCLRGEEETVTALDYSHCSLEQVPKEIFTFEKTLEELYLDANQIEELPKQLFNCQSLHKLSLPDNDLTTLPASIANLINLRELDVSKNEEAATRTAPAPSPQFPLAGNRPMGAMVAGVGSTETRCPLPTGARRDVPAVGRF
ncbi:Protein LAP2 [Chelonia mydas]|uniref:Protein LAP2 n=1 Tax=Chelonia mydas TaxID=8469 RepID=M7BH38_CHEMY|nr:Protein LAP2 [Chelonia mydas]